MFREFVFWNNPRFFNGSKNLNVAEEDVLINFYCLYIYLLN